MPKWIRDTPHPPAMALRNIMDNASARIACPLK
jgi:hypothetical protein